METIYNSQDLEATKRSVDRPMDKDVVCVYIYIYTHKGILLSYEKEWNNAIYSNMNEIIIPNELSQKVS